MIISELISKLEYAKAEHGDIEVCFLNDGQKDMMVSFKTVSISDRVPAVLRDGQVVIPAQPVKFVLGDVY